MNMDYEMASDEGECPMEIDGPVEDIEQDLECINQSGMYIRSHIQNRASTVDGPGYPSEQDCLAAHEDAQSQPSGSDDTGQEVERQIKEHSKELEKLKLIQDSMIKKELSCIDFDAYKEAIPEYLYCHINDIKSTSACPCFCVAFLINKFLFNAGYNLLLGSTEFFNLLSAITNGDEGSLRKAFCNPECAGIGVFQDFLERYLLERDLSFERGQFKTEELKRVLNRIIRKLQRSDHLFMLGIGYEKKPVGHCINVFMWNNRMAVLDPQNGGYCQLNVFEGVDDIRVYSLSNAFKEYVLKALPKTKEISFIDLLRIGKQWRNTMTEL